MTNTAFFMKIYCSRRERINCFVLDASDRDAVDKHHQKFGVKCDWITEVNITA